MRFKKLQNLFARWLPMLIWMVVIFWASNQSSDALPNYGIWDLLIKKAGHFIAYAILALFVFRGTMEWKRPYWWAFLITAVYAMSDEFHQQFVAGRNASLYDVLIDCLGAVTAIYLISRSHNLRDLVQFNLDLNNNITSVKVK